MKTKILITLIVFPFLVHGQEESFPCKCCNTKLKDQFKNKKIEYLYIHNCSGVGLGDLSSSFLLPSGPPPKIIEHEDDVPDDGDYVAWTCRYSVGNISDGDPKTTWAEGVKGYGIGEVLIVPCLDLKKPVKIWIGYGKSANLYNANSRPKTVKLHIIRAGEGLPTQYGTGYENAELIGESTVELKDLNGYQKLLVPEFKPETYFSEQFNEQRDYSYFLGIEILEVYPGTKYDDTCISEVVNE